MANKKDSELNILLGSQLDMTVDRLRITDIGAPNETKTITAEELMKGLKITSPFSSGVDNTTFTGTTVEQITKSIFIPADTIKDGDILKFKAFNAKTGANGTGTHRLSISPTNDLTAPVRLGLWNNGASTVAAVVKALREMFVITTNSQRMVAPLTGNLNTDDSAFSGQVQPLTIDFTVDQYILFTTQLGSVADSGLLVAWYVEILRKA